MTEGRTRRRAMVTASRTRPIRSDQARVINGVERMGRNHLLGHPISDQHLIQGCRALGVAKGFPLHAHKVVQGGTVWMWQRVQCDPLDARAEAKKHRDELPGRRYPDTPIAAQCPELEAHPSLVFEAEDL